MMQRSPPEDHPLNCLAQPASQPVCLTVLYSTIALSWCLCAVTHQLQSMSMSSPRIDRVREACQESSQMDCVPPAKHVSSRRSRYGYAQSLFVLLANQLLVTHLLTNFCIHACTLALQYSPLMSLLAPDKVHCSAMQGKPLFLFVFTPHLPVCQQQ